MLTQSVHWCEGCDLIEPTPFFFHQEAYDTEAETKFDMVMCAIPTAHGHTAVQVDFCPWCGAQLSNHRVFVADRGKKRQAPTEPVQADYLAYRRRLVQSGTPVKPMSEEQWKVAVQEWNEINMLLPMAKPEHATGLFNRKQVLKTRLFLSEREQK